MASLHLKRLINAAVGHFGETADESLSSRARSSPHASDSAFLDCIRQTQGMISEEEAVSLYALAKQVRTGCIVEVGSYRGRSTVALGRGSMDGHNVPVFAIDPHEEFIGVLGGKFGPEDREAFFRAMLSSSCYKVVRLLNTTCKKLAVTWDMPVSLLWIDGDHSYAGVKGDFEAFRPHLAAGSVVAFDDSTDPQLGPYRLLREILTEDGFQAAQGVGKIRTIVKTS